MKQYLENSEFINWDCPEVMEMARRLKADFFIGGHAEAIDVPIITRDVKRYITYFPSVEIIWP